MAALDTLRDGKLDEALAELQQEVRAKPDDPKLRTFLFQVLTVLGQWDRAQTQLNVIAEMDPGRLVMARTYREAIRCELLRTEIFDGKRSPLIFGEPEQWIALLMEAVRQMGTGHFAEAQKLREEAFDVAPATTGSLVRRPTADNPAPAAESFQWIADADMRLGPIFEVLVEGRYYWVPFTRLHKIVFDPPEDLRDVVWMPAHLVWTNGGDAVALIPTRYPKSHTNSDPLVRLSRMTTWNEVAPETFCGAGQKMLTTDTGEYALMDIQEITLQPIVEPAQA